MVSEYTILNNSYLAFQLLYLYFYVSEKIKKNTCIYLKQIDSGLNKAYFKAVYQNIKIIYPLTFSVICVR